LNLSRRSSANDTPLIQSADESRSNDDGKTIKSLLFVSCMKINISDDSDPNPKRRKTEEVNEALVGIPLHRG
jgi:hypothetical protein